MHRNKFLGVALAAGLAVTTVSACGGGGSKANNSLGLGGASTTAGSGAGTSSGSATDKVTSAFQKVGDNSGVQLTLSLNGSFPANTGLTAAQATAILNSQLIISADSGSGQTLAQSAGSNKSGDFELALKSGDANLGTLEIIGKTAYARVDIKQTATSYGLDQGKAEQLQQELQQAGSAIPGLTALEAGQWVSLDLTPLLQLEQKSAATSTTTAGESPAMLRQLATALINAFKQNSQITEVGSADGGTKYQAIIREKALVTAVGSAVQSVPELGAKAGSINADNIPATQTLTVDVIVKGGEVSELQLPLNQFDKTNQVGNLQLDLGIASFSGSASSSAITVPTGGATPVDISNILSELGSASSSSATTG